MNMKFQFNPLKGGTYVELPKSIAATKGVVNVKNTDNFCFLYSILALKHHADVHPERVKQYKQYLNELIYDETEFPMTIPRIRYFEKKNSIGINVYGCEKWTEKCCEKEVANGFFIEQESDATEKELKQYQKKIKECDKNLKDNEKKLLECKDTSDKTLLTKANEYIKIEINRLT